LTPLDGHIDDLDCTDLLVHHLCCFRAVTR
jgi:hypothetical protein